MKTKLTALALAATLAAAAPARAELVVPSLSYRTGPYGANGTQYADGFADYFTLLNERDGGIGGERIQVPECETAYNTEKGVECYEATKDTGALVYNPLSTGITYQLIPKVSVDKKVLYTPGYGRTSAKNGKVFEWVFNAPANYWDGASVAIKYLLDENGGDLSGKKIALVYHNSAYGKEPIRTLQKLSEKHGFELSEIPIDPPGQEQKSQWLQIRRERPDYVIMYGWGVMNQAAIQEAANIRFPMENFIGIWWAGSEVDVLPVGAGANGYKALTFNGVGMDYPVYDDIQEYVLDAGLAAGAGDQVGTVLYNRGMYAAMLTAEAVRTAQEIHGVSDITPPMMRDGMEALVIDEATMEAARAELEQSMNAVTCADHGGPGSSAIAEWDADTQSWTMISDFAEPDKELIDRLVLEDSNAYAAENNIPETRCE